MKIYVLRRVLAVIPVMLVVATVAFVLIHLAPGDPASVIAGPYAAPDDVAKLRHQLGLDEPLPVQLVRWYGRLLRGDLGDSIFLRRPVTEAILDRLEPTLTVIGITFALLIGGAVVIETVFNIPGRLYLQQAPWLTLFPGAAIMACILGLNLFGDGLRDLLDPKLRGAAGAD